MTLKFFKEVNSRFKEFKLMLAEITYIARDWIEDMIPTPEVFIYIEVFTEHFTTTWSDWISNTKSAISVCFKNASVLQAGNSRLIFDTVLNTKF